MTTRLLILTYAGAVLAGVLGTLGTDAVVGRGPATPHLAIDAEVRPVDGYAKVVPVTDAVSVTYVALDGTHAFPAELTKDPKTLILPTAGLNPGRYRFAAVAAGKTGGQVRADFAVVVGQVPPVPPGPTPPGPTPPGPTPPGPTPPPTPASSFRVFLIFESEDTLAPAERAVIYGNVVEAYLDANCTGGKAGWRRRDQNAPGEKDAAMAALWAAIQPKVTVTPCVAIERDGKVTLVNVEPTPTAMVQVLTKYKEGR